MEFHMEFALFSICCLLEMRQVGKNRKRKVARRPLYRQKQEGAE